MNPKMPPSLSESSKNNTPILLLHTLLALNIDLLMATLTSIPPALSGPILSPLYVLSLQLLVACLVVMLLCRTTGQVFDLRVNSSIAVLVLAYGVFPLPALVRVLVDGVLPRMCRC
ncbi:hypothetical protein BDW42DRAFT_180034 [Aspergillus taichungensis]|uniref:Uncharacterized protein n=1 Tax=Aspergillus taichungensis TaxID=482145 RepID=A0A2J5HFS6_9EURO|nr:hypothetical protein BDW42DRAFT_180034 [Aspergillus taichungensis]